jgi:hypothetical protein
VFGIEIPLWVVLLYLLLFGLAIVSLIVTGALVASIPSVIAALLARRWGKNRLQSRAIARMSFRDVIIAVAAATTVAAPLGGAIGYSMGSYVALFAVTWLIAVPLSAIILFSDANRRH